MKFRNYGTPLHEYPPHVGRVERSAESLVAGPHHGSEPCYLLILLFLTLMLPASARAAELGSEAYRLPLIEPYAIYRSDKNLGVSTKRGPYQLVEVMPSGPGVGLSTRILVPKVKLVADRDGVIFGKAADGFFILDTHQSDPQPQVVSARGEWEAALRRLGISDPNVVEVPDEIAVGIPERVLRPWKYRALGGGLGISDDAFSLIVELLGLVLAFILGVLWPRGKSPMAAAAVLGLVVNVVAQILIAGGGPGAFVGFVAVPLLCMLAAVLGKGLRTILFRGHPAD
jgi:hypothetical protein